MYIETPYNIDNMIICFRYNLDTVNFSERKVAVKRSFNYLPFSLFPAFLSSFPSFLSLFLLFSKVCSLYFSLSLYLSLSLSLFVSLILLCSIMAFLVLLCLSFIWFFFLFFFTTSSYFSSHFLLSPPIIFFLSPFSPYLFSSHQRSIAPLFILPFCAFFFLPSSFYSFLQSFRFFFFLPSFICVCFQLFRI